MQFYDRKHAFLKTRQFYAILPLNPLVINDLTMSRDSRYDYA